jgi:hypothetical protein
MFEEIIRYRWADSAAASTMQQKYPMLNLVFMSGTNGEKLIILYSINRIRHSLANSIDLLNLDSK